MDLPIIAMLKRYVDEKVSASSGGGLPVVELTTQPTTEGAQLTAEESAAIDALNGTPCIIHLACELSVGGSLSVKAFADATIASGIPIEYSTATVNSLGGRLTIFYEGGWFACIE